MLNTVRFSTSSDIFCANTGACSGPCACSNSRTHACGHSHPGADCKYASRSTGGNGYTVVGHYYISGGDYAGGNFKSNCLQYSRIFIHSELQRR